MHRKPGNGAGDPVRPADSDYVSSAQAAALLGVKVQTVYTYVSHGIVQSLPTPDGRRRLYLRADLEKLRSRPKARLPLGAAAASAMYGGDPIIATSITEITPAGPCYRGKPALELANRRLRFENVAEFLWTGELLEDHPVAWDAEPLPRPVRRLAAALERSDSGAPIAHLFSLFALAIGLSRGSASERLRSSSTVLAARQLIQTFAGCFGYLSPRRAYAQSTGAEPVAGMVLRACGVTPSEEKLGLLNALMVLLADHELSPATFAARIAASGGADLQACIVSAIETSSGRKIAQLYDRTEDFLAGATSKTELLQRVQDLQAMGQAPPGFNQPIYPQGDPRAPYVFDLVRKARRPSRHRDMVLAFLDEAQRRFGLKPRMEFGVVALARELGLPRRAAGGLYILARVAGWVAHVMEQRLSSALLRPRAKFVD